ncbi:MAG: hypothetical protein DI527_12380 [Chelatococcus sp.]|nr:MAG: hypothetical protein DI527_12380 [Chelatococcus sp.]
MLHRQLISCLATGTALLWAATPPAAAETFQTDTPFPMPRPTLAEPLDETAPPSAGETSAEPLLFQPDLGAIGRQNAEANLHVQARRPIPVDVIRKGFQARGDVRGPVPERSVGFRFGAETFSLSTTLVRPEGDGPGGDARIGWQASQPLSDEGSDVIWRLSTGGSGSLAGNPEQTGKMLLGYRYRLLPHLTLTPQLGLDGNYVFVAGDGWHSSITPTLKLSADLSAMADLPWETSFDIDLSRRVPLVASDFETKGTAMLRLKYTLQ